MICQHGALYPCECCVRDSERKREEALACKREVRKAIRDALPWLEPLTAGDSELRRVRNALKSALSKVGTL